MADQASRPEVRRLNETEHEFLALARQGYTSREIAQALSLQGFEFAARIQAMLFKLGLTGRLELWQLAATYPCPPRALHGDAATVLARRSMCGNHAGLRRLAAGILHEAREDFFGGPVSARASAVSWLAGLNKDGVSFELCCELLDRTPEAVRREFSARLVPSISLVPPQTSDAREATLVQAVA